MKPAVIRLFALLAIVVPFGVAAAAEQTRVIDLNDLLIEGIYRSMEGPVKEDGEVQLLDPGTSDYLWITRFRTEVLDAGRRPTRQEFLCHSGVIDDSGGPVLSIAQGQEEIVFPERWALRLPNQNLKVLGMVLNNNYADMREMVNIRATISFFDDASAREWKTRPLRLTAATIHVPTVHAPDADPEVSCLPADPGHKSKVTSHWMVPPGKHRYSSPVRDLPPFWIEEDTRIHYIWMHVHPYARSMELRDVTAGETVWRGEVHNHATLAAVLGTDHYADANGTPLYADHDYEVSTIYDNPTDHDIDAMAALWIYVAD